MKKIIFISGILFWLWILISIIFVLIEKMNYIFESDKNNIAISESLQKFESENKHPPVTSNEDFYGERTNFTFSPDKKYIAFVQNVFDEYGSDWDRYWALKVFKPESGEEKTLFVDNTRMSSYQWLDSSTIRIFHSGGTGVRGYADLSVHQQETIFSKDFTDPASFWTVDEEYVQKVKDFEEARRIYEDFKNV